MSDQTPVSPNGQVAIPVQAQPTAEAPFFEIDWEQGNKAGRPAGKEVFKSKEELAKRLREGTLFHAGFTVKTQELAKQREALAKRESDFERTMQELMEKKNKLDPMDKFLSDNPQIAERIVAEMRGKTGQVGSDQLKKMIDEAIKPFQEKLSETEAWKQEQETERRRKEIFSQFKTQHPDFNEEAISQRMKEFDELPDGEEDRAYIELLYLAEKGRNPSASPAEIEAKVADSLNAKAGKRSPVPSVHAAPPLKDELPASVRSSRDPIKAAAEHYKKTHA